VPDERQGGGRGMMLAILPGPDLLDVAYVAIGFVLARLLK
jgi:hypothetical protein